MRTAYKVRVYPIPEQAAVLGRTFGCVRLVWNKVLAWRHARYHPEGVKTSYAETDRYLTRLKREPEYGFLFEVSSVPLQQALRHRYTAFVNFFAGRARYPRCKSRHGRQWATYTRSAFRWRGGKLWLAKMDTPWSSCGLGPTSIRPRSTRPAVTISRDVDGRWYASLAVETDTAPEPLPATGRAVGVDLGVKDFAVTSDGERIPNPRHLERKARNLARYQRRMARKRRGSANRAKAKVARAHVKVRDARRDFLHKTTTRLVRDHDVIAIEGLNVRGMTRNRSLAKAISDCGWGEFRRLLEYRCTRYGRTLVVADRWHPASKTCSACGRLLAELSLSTRHWTCPTCRTRHDRDINTAKNILAAGRAVTACGADVRRSGSSRVRSAAKQEAQPARAGIPRL